MAGTDEIKSVVAIDFGSVNTRVVLVDMVDGAYRMVARAATRTTADDPVRDVVVGLFRALNLLSDQTGRKMVASGAGEPQVLMPEEGGAGVDALLATASVGQPLAVVVVGLMPDVSVNSALHVLTGSYVRVVDRISLADIRTEEEQVNAVLAKKPDLIFIVGGTDAGAETPILEMVRVVRSAVQMAAKKPMVLYAGNRAVQAEVREMLEDVARLFVVDNIRPSLTEESLGPAQQGLAAVFNAFKADGGGGFDEVGEISAVGVLPAAQSFTNVVRYLGEVTTADKNNPALGVMAVDVGSSTTTVAASIRRRPYINIRTDIGVGHSADGVLAHTTPGNIRRWLTWDASNDEIAAYAYNKTLRPASVPQTAEELELEYALTREAIRVVVEQAKAQWRISRRAAKLPMRPIIGAGAVLANAPHSGYAALMLLDAIQPVGTTEIWLDPAGLIPALGAMGYLLPSAVVQMLDEGDLLKVGSVVCAEGRVRRIGGGGMRVKIKLEDGYEERKNVAAGTIWTYPLPPGQTAKVEVRLSRGLSVNGKSRVKLTLEGGASGLIFDARGRPLPLPRKAEARAQLYPAWVAGMRGVLQLRLGDVDESQVDKDVLGKVEIMGEAEDMLMTPDGDGAQDEAPRRGLFGFLRRGGAQEAPAEDEEPKSELMAELEAVAAARTEDEKAGDAEPVSRRRGLFGRRKTAEPVEAEPEPAAEDEPEPADQDELADMMDSLRDSTTEDDSGGKRRFFRR